MTGIFKANNPSGNAILFIYAIVLKLPMFLHMRKPELQTLDGVFYKFILQIFNPLAAVFSPIYSILTFILLYAQAVGLNRIVNNQRLLKQNNYLTGMSYLLITSLFSDWFSFSAPLIVNTFLIWIWAKLCTFYNNPHPKATIFNIGLVSGVAAFIYFPSISFLLLVFVGIAIARPFRLQEWLSILVGVITPLYIFGACLFLTDNVGNYKYPGFHFSFPHFFGNRWAYAALFMIIFATAIGLYFVNTNMRKQVVQTRKSWQLLFLYIAVATAVPFMNAAVNFSYWILLAVPISPVIGAAFFYPTKKIVTSLLYWTMVAIFVAIGFLGK